MTEIVQSWRDIETYASKINVFNQSKKEQQDQYQKLLETTTNFTSALNEVGMLWSKPETNPPNYGSALGHLYFMERRSQREPKLKELYQQSIV